MRSGPNRWLVLVLVCIAQFMVILDATIVNVALPSIQKALDITPASLQWIVNAYTLVFGGFLLLGGRAADLLGRQRLFIAGVIIFTAASLLNGLATSEGVLIAGRALQGLGGALVSPAALSIVTTTFAEGKERTQALGVWSAIAAGGGAVGLVLGGFLTETFSWRWVFFINLPIGIAAALLSLRYVPNSRAEKRPQTYDVAGAVTVTGGLLVLVYAIVKAQSYGWGSGKTIALFVVALLLLAAFVAIEQRSKAPLIRLGIFRLRSLSGSNVAMLLVASGLFAMFYFASLYLQGILGYKPLEAGFAFLPFTLGIVIGAGASQALIRRIGIRLVSYIGITMGAIGLLYFGRLPVDGSYVRDVLPDDSRGLDRHGHDVRPAHPARDDERRLGGCGTCVGALQHVAAGRRRARPGDPLDARGIPHEPPVERRPADARGPRRRGHERLPRRLRGRRADARGRARGAGGDGQAARRGADRRGGRRDDAGLIARSPRSTILPARRLGCPSGASQPDRPSSRSWALPSSAPPPPATPRPAPAPSSAGSSWGCLVLLSLVLITRLVPLDRARPRAEAAAVGAAAVRGRGRPRRAAVPRRRRLDARPLPREVRERAAAARERRRCGARLILDEAAVQENVQLQERSCTTTTRRGSRRTSTRSPRPC